MISLVIPTINRRNELDRLLESILESSYDNYEVIVVDQNEKGYLDDIIEKYKRKLNILHLNVDFKGASKARNYGAALCNGDIINFPDDDSELDINLLKNVNEYFKNNNYDVIFGRTLDKRSNKPSVIKFFKKEMDVTIKNLYNTTVECTMFIKKDVFLKIGGFDERLGVGTFYGAEEGADIVLRMLYKKYKMIYLPQIIFYHPDKVENYSENEWQRAYSYGLGFGRLTVKHFIEYKKIYPVIRFFKMNFKQSIAVFLYFLKKNKGKRKYYLNSVKGRIMGVKLSIKDFIK